jgi:hypothetical protein
MQLEPNQTLVITVLTGVVNYKQLMYGGMRAAAQKTGVCCRVSFDDAMASNDSCGDGRAIGGPRLMIRKEQS